MQLTLRNHFYYRNMSVVLQESPGKEASLLDSIVDIVIHPIIHLFDVLS